LTSYVFDASAILALLLDEPGGDVVRRLLAESRLLSTVNLAEVVSKLTDYGLQDVEIGAAMGGLQLTVVEFDERTATVAGQLRRETRSLGLSLGDRACLASAMVLGHTAVTADRDWSRLTLPAEVLLVR
jgi:ribonuclease VapC